MEAFAALELSAPELLKRQDIAEIHLLASNRLLRALLARVRQEESRLTSCLRQYSQLTSMVVRQVIERLYRKPDFLFRF